VLERLQQLQGYVCNADEHIFWDRLVDFRYFCETTPALACSLAQLPPVPYDWGRQWHQIMWPLRPEERCAFRWDAIKQLTDDKYKPTFYNRLSRIRPDPATACGVFAREFVGHVCDYLSFQIRSSGATLYLLSRYKCWAEWFGYARLREVYRKVAENRGDHRKWEDPFDEDVRRFLFESGVDYPLSQPRVPGGQVDIVASLDTNDPLVLEVKLWDSARDYRVNKVCDGLRQVRHYAEKYGKDAGYVVVFNFDDASLEFQGDPDTGQGPARIVRGNRTYYFIDVHIPESQVPVSQRDKGKPVKVHTVPLAELWDEIEETSP
jgi:hypothetical protein